MMTPSGLVVEIQGHRYELSSEEWDLTSCTQTGPQDYQLTEHGISYLISVLDMDIANRRFTLRADGEIVTAGILRDLDLLIEKMGLNTAQSKKQNMLHAPMPGLVTGIKIMAGQPVEKGAPLMILEAMKMENVITSPQHAIIKEVKVVVGQAVDKGTLLVEFVEA